MALSLRGVVRKRYGITGSFSVINDVLSRARHDLSEQDYRTSDGSVSLRSLLSALTRAVHHSSAAECIYDTESSYEQTWSHIRIRIKLNPDADVSDAVLTNLKSTWASTISNVWSNKFGIGHAGEATCPLTFEAVWVDKDAYDTVRVSTGPGRSDSGHFFTTIGSCVAHEYGHMFGLVDEYPDPNCPSRSPVNTGTVMDNCSSNVVARFMTRFADNVGSSVVTL